MFLFKNPLLSQLNLIQNCSFEYYTALNCVGGASSVNNWSGFLSPDYNSLDCNNSYRGVPINNIGVSYAKHGMAYMGIISYIKTGEQKEYIYQQLTSPLIADSIYCLSFYVSRADYIPYAIKNIGAYFSNNVPNHVYFVTATPQVVNNSTFITDTINWTEIQGCFIAQGGEQYITIGNFNSNANTDTLFVGTTNQVFGGNGYAYYYIDSVTLYQNNFPTAIKESDKDDGFSVYPNPAKDVLNIDFGDTNEKRRIVIYDAVGEIVLSEDLKTQNATLNIHHLPSGIYFYCILVNGIKVNTNKIVIIK